LLQNLFGTPAQERRIEGTLILSPTVPSFRSYPDFRFTDPLRTKDGYSTPLGEGKTDAKGEAEFPLGLEKYGSATFQLNFLARGFEAEGGRSVAGAVRTLVSSLDYLVGIKTDGDLDYIKRGAARKIKVIAIDPSARKIAQSELKAQLIEHKYVSVLTKQDSGVYKYESRAKDVPVSEQPVAIPAEGLEYQLPTDAPGNFALVLRNAKGEELNRIDYAVSGEANLARSLERNAELQLSLSKHDYAPGEEIEIAVRAPYTGSGLITIERDQVYAHVWFKTKTTSSVQKIKVPAGFEGNGYVNVQFLRDPGSDEIYMSPLSYGVAAFSVDRDARRDKLTLSVPDKIKPGETLVMKLKAAEPARVALFAVDEGILQVARYKLGDPLDLFFQKRMLEVETNQILDLVLPEFSKLIAMAAAPGGDADSLIARHLNPFKKKHQEPVAYWSGIVEVKGEREFRYQVPDYFNGKVRVMVVAVTPARIGITESGTLVRGDFVLSPNAPAMVAPGDEFEVSVGVANNLEGQKPGEMPVAVELASEAGLEVVGAAKQELKLAPQREGSARFRLRAREALGPAKLTFKVSTGEYGAKQSAEVSVRPAVPYRSSVTFGSLAQTKVDLKTGPALYDEHAKRTLAAAYTPLVLAQGLSAYLGDYPHRCTEQLISQGYPALVFSTRPEFGAVQADAAGKADPFAALFDEMHARQNGEGGFGAWSATPTADRFVSAYAIQFLLEARERGRAVPADMLALGNGYLQQLAADESDSSMAGLRERAFAVYLLTRQGNVTSNALAAVEKRLDERFAKTWRDDVTAAYLGAALKLMREDKEAARLVAGPEKILVRHAEERGYTIERYFDPLLSDAVTLYLVSKHFPDRAKALPAEALTNLVHPLQRGWFNTITSATTILALDGYAGSTAPAGVGTLALAEVGKDGAAKPFGAAQGQVMRGGFGGAVPTLRIGNELGSSAWYSLTQAGFARAVPTDEVKQGFELQREYRDAGGKAVTSVALGDELDVHLRVRATRPDGVNSVALVDLLPGGFEPVLEPPPNPDDAANAPTAPVAPVFGSPKSTWRPDFADVRDDRVVVYGFIGPDLKEFIYRIKATNAGTFQIPPAYGEGMYDRTIEARRGGGRMTVERKEGAK
jgi:uncharacterized protein YfaS (alpha-2-macroglobulin family)